MNRQERLALLGSFGSFITAYALVIICALSILTIVAGILALLTPG